jgi:P27 family predicted phage terminase small subunit
LSGLTTPKFLGKIGRKEWKRIYKILKDENFDFCEKDAKALESYASCYETWITCEEFLNENGYTFETEKGYIMQRPEVAIGKKANESMRAWAKELGLTPSSRARMGKQINKNIIEDEELEGMIAHG